MSMINHMRGMDIFNIHIINHMRGMEMSNIHMRGMEISNIHMINHLRGMEISNMPMIHNLIGMEISNIPIIYHLKKYGNFQLPYDSPSDRCGYANKPMLIRRTGVVWTFPKRL